VTDSYGHPAFDNRHGPLQRRSLTTGWPPHEKQPDDGVECVACHSPLGLGSIREVGERYDDYRAVLGVER
jgi:hypothetical protein